MGRGLRVTIIVGAALAAFVALGALTTITLGFALRPRRRSFPVPR